MRLLPPALACLALASASPAAAQRPVPLDTVHVTAGSRLIAGAAAVTRSVDVFDRAMIEALPARSVSEVIARALGADLLARSPAQADLSIRGSSFEQILVLVDGVPVNDLQTGHFHLDVAVPLDAVERVEIVRGPASAVYGSSAIGGVVNIVTRRLPSPTAAPRQSDGAMHSPPSRITTPGISARVQRGSFDAWSFGAGVAVSGDRVSARIDGDHDEADGHRAGTDHRTSQARLSLDAPLARGALRAAAGYAARNFGARDFYAPFDSYEETRTATASAAWRSRPAALVLEPRVSFRHHEDDFILQRADPSFYRNVHTTGATSAELVARWRARDRMSVAAGGELLHSSLESNSLGERTENRVAGFAEAAFGDVSSSLITLGVRLDHHSAFGAFLSTSAAAGYRLSPALRVRASAASGFRAPSWTDRYYEDPANLGDPDLDAERFWTAELGAEVRSGPLLLDMAGFVRRATDLIDWGRPAVEVDDVVWRTMNIDRATFLGLETTVRARLRAAAITGRAAVLSFEAGESDGFVSKYALQPLTRSASIEIALPVVSSGLVAVRASASRRADGESWQVLDARASATAFGVRIFADATNILDDSWLDVSARPAAGRAFSVGARVRR